MNSGRKILPVVLGGMVLALCAAGTVFAQEDSIKTRMMAEYQMLAQPGPEHERLAAMEGTWTNQITMWLEPGAEPMTSTSKSTNEMVLGGRFLMTRGTGEMMGTTMERLSLMGFDRREGTYNHISLDNFGTYWVLASGKYDEDNKAIRMYSEYFDPVMKCTQKCDMIVTFESDDVHHWEVIYRNPEMTGGADEFKMVDVISTRQK
jgi:hypothetical protein